MIQWACLYVCYLTYFLRYSSWLSLCYRCNLLQSIRLCPFWARSSLCQWTCTNLLACHVIHSEMLNVSHSPTHFFSSFYLSLPAHHQLGQVSQLQQSQSPCDFLFLMWLLLQMLYLIIRFFILRIVGFPYLGS